MYDENGKAVTKAYPGQQLGMVVSVKNEGDTDDIFVNVIDKDTYQPLVRSDGVKTSWYTSLAADQTWGAQIAIASGPGYLVMPNKQWNIIVEAGHGTVGTQI